MKMKYLSLILFVILVTNHQKKLFIHVEASGGFIRTSGGHFVLGGTPFFANGFNAYWLMYMASDPSQRAKVSTAFQEASSHGLTVARTWAFSDGGGYGALQYSPGSYNEQTFKGLDFVVSEARRYGIRLIMSLVNDYENFGGKKQYVQWARSQGQSIGSDDEFFTNPVVKGYYKNHVKTVLTRFNSFTGVAYKDDPTIFAWELMNEPKCASDTSGKTLQSWITEMAAHVKSIDSSHLLEIGLEGFYGESSPRKNAAFQVGTDFIANNQIPGIDFATVHSYPDQWLSGSNDQTQLSFLNDWLDTHIQDAQNILHKPLLITEFGKSWKDPGFSSYQRDTMFNLVYSKIYSSARNGGVTAGGLFWQLLTEGMDSFRDGYEIILNESPSVANVISLQSRKLRYLGKLYARLRNIQRWKKAHANGRLARNNKNIGN
ncbi:Mannan endo-1,4-beta-mannosidase 1 [Acorus calamus]|uniref:mannan endo-1,4-beta-mannosidase n=1 Tax=Acorus calamus TaxID=4465 RepID=A0AAV9DCP2_ACOCL|nr:Mannan endo-1,4-beta-mannosidase 1 [Acorus calamus]